MKRPLRSAPAAGAPNWLVTFADLMTLLLTFFILLLSFSNLDTEKYKAIAYSMSRAFGLSWIEAPPGGPTQAPHAPIGPLESPAPAPEATAPEPADVPAPEPPLTAPEVDTRGQTPTDALGALLITGLEDAVAREQVQVTWDADQVTLRFSEKVTFPSGTAELMDDIKPLMTDIAAILSRCEGEIRVMGHTDDRPVQTGAYRSNWDLSAARAVSVVHELVRDRRLDAGRVLAVGRAETVPLVPNTSEANRARNRRVEIQILHPRCRPDSP